MLQGIKNYLYLCSDKYFCKMKKVIDASVGGRAFTLEEDAYKRLAQYLEHFRARLSPSQVKEVMEDIESRIAELFFAEVGAGGRVVTLSMVEKVCATLGMPDGAPEGGERQQQQNRDEFAQAPSWEKRRTRKLYRDVDDKALGGVCSGLAHYFDIDVTIVRLILLLFILFGSAGLWIYLVLWIVIPGAYTSAQKCEMNGMEPNAANMGKFTSYNQ